MLHNGAYGAVAFTRHKWPLTGMNLCEIFGRNVRRERRAQDISQEELADRAGLHRVYLGELERGGGRNPTLKVVERIAAALGVTASDLMRNDDQ